MELTEFLHCPMVDAGLPFPVFLLPVLLLGACVGSFLNVCIWRIPRRESVIFVPSHCPRCNAPIRWFDNVPIFSYLILGGHCRHCRGPISPRYILVETGTMLLLALLFCNDYVCGLPAGGLLRDLGLLIVVIPCAFIDVEHGILPDRLTGFGMIWFALAALLFPEALGGTTAADGVKIALTGWIAGGLGLWLYAKITAKLFRQRTFGGGDVKYAAFLGMAFSWIGLLLALLTAAVGAAVGYGLLQVLRRQRLQKDAEVRFGPYLGAGAVLTALLLPWLRSWFTLKGF